MQTFAKDLKVGDVVHFPSLAKDGSVLWLVVDIAITQSLAGRRVWTLFSGIHSLNVTAVDRLTAIYDLVPQEAFLLAENQYAG